MASIAKLPTPGQPKTLSMMKEPQTSDAMFMPRMVMMGSSVFFKTCLRRICAGVQPLALEARTYSSLSCPMVLART